MVRFKSLKTGKELDNLVWIGKVYGNPENDLYANISLHDIISIRIPLDNKHYGEHLRKLCLSKVGYGIAVPPKSGIVVLDFIVAEVRRVYSMISKANIVNVGTDIIVEAVDNNVEELFLQIMSKNFEEG